MPKGALNERLRFDDAGLFGEMMSNSFRRISDSEVDALNGGKRGTDGDLSGSYIRIPPGFLEHMKIYNGDDTRLYYLPDKAADGAIIRATSSTARDITTSPCACHLFLREPTNCVSDTRLRVTSSEECCSSIWEHLLN